MPGVRLMVEVKTTPTPHKNTHQHHTKLRSQYKGGASEASGASELRYRYRSNIRSDTEATSDTNTEATSDTDTELI